jgi:hypothetical protein
MAQGKSGFLTSSICKNWRSVMHELIGPTRVAGWILLGIALTLGVAPSGLTDRRARGGESPNVETGDDQAVADARALVEALRAQLRSTEASLAKAKVLLAELEAKSGTILPADGPKIDSPKEGESNRVEGVWRIVGINGHDGSDFRKPPSDEYKIMTAGHYLWLSFDLKTGDIVRSGGGTYSIKDGVYTARIDCSRATDLRAVAGLEYRGTSKVEGKKWYLYGHVPNGAVFDELWERVH